MAAVEDVGGEVKRTVVTLLLPEEGTEPLEVTVCHVKDVDALDVRAEIAPSTAVPATSSAPSSAVPAPAPAPASSPTPAPAPAATSARTHATAMPAERGGKEEEEKGDSSVDPFRRHASAPHMFKRTVGVAPRTMGGRMGRYGRRGKSSGRLTSSRPMMAAIGEDNSLDVKRSIYGMRMNRPVVSSSDSSSSDDEDDVVVEAWEVDMALWAHVWITSVVLSEMLATPRVKALLPSTRVFELGAGSGLPSAVAALSGAKSVIAADLYASGLQLARQTADANGVDADAVQCAVFDWNDACDDPMCGAFDLVMGSDVMYVPHAAEPILARVKQLLSPQGVAVITDPGRVACDDFVRLCEEDETLNVVRHTVPFVRISSTTIPKLWVVVCSRPDAPADGIGAKLSRAIDACIAHYRDHRSNPDVPASSIKETLF